jgi:hypothetical protein
MGEMEIARAMLALLEVDRATAATETSAPSAA